MAYSLLPVKSVVVCGNRRQDHCLDAVRHLVEMMCESGLEVRLERRFLDYVRDHVGLPEAVAAVDAPFGDVDVVVSVGGDGTFLRTARKVGRSGIPVAGINTGHLGFLANFQIERPDVLVSALCEGGADVEGRELLEVSCAMMPADAPRYALNEVAILKAETSSMIDVKVKVDGRFVANYLADGLVIATPTGSTAYNLSVGGPILHPELSCMVLSPIAPHSLTIRPMVIGGDRRLSAVTESRASDFRVSIDGSWFILPCGEEVSVNRADFKVNVVRRPGEDFASTLREKLLWGRR